MRDTLRRAYAIFLRLTGGLIFVFGAALVGAGVSTIWLIPTQLQVEIAARLQEIQLSPRLVGGGSRFLSGGILYLAAALLIYPPFRNRIVSVWDGLTPTEPEYSPDWTTFMLIEPNMAPTGFIIALLATAVLQGIPLI